MGWWQVSQSPPSPAAITRMPLFAGDRSCEIELHQTGVICLAPTTLIVQCVKKLNFRCTCFFVFFLFCFVFQANCKSYTTMISPCFSRLVCFFDGIVCFINIRFCSSGRLSLWDVMNYNCIVMYFN